MSLYDHIDCFTEIVLAKKSIKLKKITLRMQMNFIVNYRAWKLVGDKKALKEIIFDHVINPKKVKNDLYSAIALQIKNDIEKNNKVEGEEEEEKKKDQVLKNWLAEVIAFFGYYCGWEKEKTLDLFITEVKTLIEDVGKLIINDKYANQDLGFEAHYFAVNNPTKYKSDVVLKREKFKVENKEIDKLRKINSAFMAKSFGGKDAVS